MGSDFRSALSLLTILRVAPGESREPGRMYAWFPLVGLLIGGAAAASAWLPLPAPLRAFITLGVWVGMTGGLHLDGLADACDGLLATVSPERRLEIMRDPRAGSWAVIGVTLLLLGKLVALQNVPAAYLILPPVVGRWVMVLAAWGFPPARSTGAAAHFRRGLGVAQVTIASLIAALVLAVVAVAAWWLAALMAVIGPLCAWLVGRWAAQRLGGGLTGDVYGALCELSELVCLLLLSTIPLPGGGM